MLVMTHYVLAFYLITSEKPVILQFKPVSYLPFLEYTPSENLLHASNFAAFNLELFSEQNTPFSKTTSYNDTLSVVNDYYHKLAGAPPAVDSILFPPHELISSWKDLNNKYAVVLTQNHYLWSYRSEDIRLALVVLMDIYQTLELADESTSNYSIYVRRLALKKLRDRIGYDNYYHGQLPQPIPDCLLYQN